MDWKAPGRTGVGGDTAGVADGGFQSCNGICNDKDWDRIILKLFFLGIHNTQYKVNKTSI